MITIGIPIAPPRIIDTPIDLSPIIHKATNLARETRFTGSQQMAVPNPISDTLIARARINKTTMCKIAPTLTIRAPNTERTPKRPNSVGLEARIQIARIADSPTPETLTLRVRIKVIPRGRMLEEAKARRLLLNPSLRTQLTIGSLMIKGIQIRRSQRRVMLDRRRLK